jgi:hypothetical protein
VCARGSVWALLCGPSTSPLDVIVSRAAVLIGAFIGGAVTALLAVYVALLLAPDLLSATDIDDALAVAVRRPLSQFPTGSVVYLRVSPTLLPRLQHEYPSIRLMPWATRPEDHGCDSRPGVIVVGACLRDDFVRAELASFPMPRTAIVSFGTSNSGGQLILFKIGGHWHILVEHGFVI